MDVPRPPNDDANSDDFTELTHLPLATDSLGTLLTELVTSVQATTGHSASITVRTPPRAPFTVAATDELTRGLGRAAVRIRRRTVSGGADHRAAGAGHGHGHGDALGALPGSRRRVRRLFENSGLRSALVSRSVIDQAIGILVAHQRGGVEEAFAMLRQTSQSRNIKLRDVAEQIVARAQRQTPGPPLGRY